MVLVQNWPLFQLFFLGNKGQENVFYDILHRKNVFVAYKNKKFKESKNWHFSKGVNQCFRSRNGQFSNFFVLGNRGEENVFSDILERKKAFLGYKNKKFKKSKNWHFSKVVNPWFLSNNEPFSNIYFLRSSKSHKINIFPKGLTNGFGPKMDNFQVLFFT